MIGEEDAIYVLLRIHIYIVFKSRTTEVTMTRNGCGRLAVATSGNTSVFMSKSWSVLTRHTGFAHERAPTLHEGETRGHGVGLM